jgi:membrane associated rhomboid family serine protease
MNITYILLGVTVVTSLMAFNNRHLIDNLIFYPYRMWRNNEWYRLISCSFVHADMGHLLFNMIALWSFGVYIESSFESLFGSKGHFLFLAMYFGAVATADIINLFKQKDNPGYRSLGASGGIAAVIFSYILLNPFGGINIFFFPAIPAFVFGPLYLAYCVYMAKRGTDNIGHLAHFTGSIFGFIFPIIFEPRLFMYFVNQLLGNV